MEAPMSEGLVQPAKLVASSRHGSGNPLCVGIRSDIYERSFGKDAKETEILGLQVAEPAFCQTGSCRLLVSCAPQPLSLDSAPRGSVKDNKNAVHIYCTKDFLSHYRCKNNQKVTLCFIREPPVLQKVVLEAKTEKAFNWVNSETFSVAALAGVCKARLLARQGDVLLFPPLPQLCDDPSQQSELSLDVHAVSCQPVIQGVLSLNTAITIVRNFRPVPEADVETLHHDDEGPSPVTRSPLIISDFAFRKTGHCQNLCPEKVLLNIHVVQYNILTLLPLDEQIIDENNTVFINLKTAQKHGIFTNCYTIARLQTCDGNLEISEASKCEGESAGDLNSAESQKSKEELRYVRIRVLKKKRLEVDTVYMNHNLYFNLLPPTSAHHSLSRYKLAIQRPTFTHVGSTSSCISQTLPTASELHLTLIHSPNYSLSVRCDSQLKNYFQIQRLVSIGDILCLPEEEDSSRGQTLGASASSSVVYFKVKKVLPSHGKNVTWIVNTNTTSVFQDGSIHSYVPIPADPFFGHEMPPGLDKYHRELCDLVLPQISSEIDEETAPATLITGPAGCGKSSLVHSMARQLNLHIVTENCHNLCGETSGATEARIKAAFHQAQSCAPCVLLLLNIDALGKDRDGLGEDPRVAHNFVDVTKATSKDDTWPVVTFATAKSTKDVSADIISVFLHQIAIEVPDEEIRAAMFKNLLKRTPCSPDVNIRYLSQRTAGMVLGDLKALISHATREAMNRVLTACSADESGHMTWEQEESVSMAGVVVQQCDFQRALDNLQGAQSDAMGAPKIPNVTWADVGGLADVKSEILDTIQLPLQHPELLAAGLRRSGVLLYGPPGTGKTLLAKAVATECSLNFLSVKGPELINMYVGQSEENVREVFKRARNATPCVIFFDELDSLAPNRGRSGDSGGVMDRVVSQLLAELDGMQKSCDVFVIGATNRPDLLDPALLRPGRFDKLLYLGVSEDRQSQLRILQALTRKFTLSEPDVCDAVVEKCPFNLTGADFYALCSDAMLNALKRKIDQLEAGEDVDQTNVVVTEEDFDKALDSLVPSVSEAQLAHYKSLKYSFKAQ